MRKIYFVLLLLIPVISFAQSNFKSGYIVDLKGDTLRGYINFKEWGNNPESIDFKTLLTDKASQLGIDAIQYFEINGFVSYSAYEVSLSLNAIDIASPSSAADTATIRKKVFLKVLEKGKYVTLYSYKDNLKPRYYIRDDNSSIPYELIYGIYQDANTDNLVYKNTYRVQLTSVANKFNTITDELNEEIQRANYKDYELIPIAVQINGASFKQANAKVSNRNPPVRFYAGAAFISSTLSFTDGNPFYGAGTYSSSSPKISIGADLFANPDVGHLIFRMELGYAIAKFDFVEPENRQDNAVNPITGSEIFKMDELFITPQVIYNFYNTSLLKVFLDAGYSINILSYPSTTLITTQDNKVINTTTIRGLDASKGNSPTFMFKGGVVVSNRFEIYGAYFLSAQITNALSYNSSFSSVQVGLNYFIGKVAH